MRLPLLAVLLCAAVGASAAGVYVTTWTMRTADRDDFRVEKYEPGVLLHVGGIGVHDLTNEEAASLGRALLEAAGETKKPCAATWPGPESLNVKSCPNGLFACTASIPSTCSCSGFSSQTVPGAP